MLRSFSPNIGVRPILLSACLLFSLSFCSTKPSADLYLYNANGYSLSGDSLVQFTAMAIKDGKVLAIGDTSELAQQYRYDATFDVKGKTLLPGLIDAHGHVMGLGHRLMQVNLEGTKSVNEAIRRIQAYVQDNPDVDWILGGGWNQVLWEDKQFPTAAQLDSLPGDKPIFLRRVDGHAAWANQIALQRAGISRETTDPPGGRILRDKLGNPTGVLIDKAMDMVEQVIPAANENLEKQALQKALEQLRSLGITSTHDAGIDYNTYLRYREFAEKGQLTTRIYAMISGVGKDFDQISADGLLKNYLNDFLSVRSVKLYGDGALGSRGAALLQPYHDDAGNHGLLFYQADTLSKMILKAVKKGYQVNVHAIGDAANKAALDAYAITLDSVSSSMDLRHRIEHAQVVLPDDFPRFKSLNIIASMQPVHATSDKNMAEDRLGKDRILGAYAWRTVLMNGIVLASGSDYPVEHANPFHGLYAAITRMDTLGNPIGGWYPDQKLNRFEALKSFTHDAAYAGHQEQVLGSLTPGKWADFSIVDQDYFKVPDSSIWRTKVLQTFVAGKPVFTRP